MVLHGNWYLVTSTHDARWVPSPSLTTVEISFYYFEPRKRHCCVTAKDESAVILMGCVIMSYYCDYLVYFLLLYLVSSSLSAPLIVTHTLQC